MMEDDMTTEVKDLTLLQSKLSKRKIKTMADSKDNTDKDETKSFDETKYDHLNPFQQVEYPPGRKKYRAEFCEVAVEVLSKDNFQSKTHLCQALGIVKTTLLSWEKSYPDFAYAIQVGLNSAEVLTRDKMKDQSWLPQRDVNNGLIKILANNVYGIKDEEPDIIINTGTVNNITTEEEMERRGIPSPDVGGVEDIDDMEEE